MGGRERVHRRRRMSSPLREIGRETLVEQLDGDVDDTAERVDEALGLVGLLAVRAAHRQRQADDDALDVLLAHEPRQLGEPALRACPLDDAEWTREDDRKSLPAARALLWPLGDLAADAMRAALTPPGDRAL
jgi:hypothetical protein